MLDKDLYGNPNNLPQFQAMSPQLAGQPQVPMQAVNPELLKENIQDSYIANRISETTEDPNAGPYTALIALPSWFAIAKGMDYYAKASRGEFEDTVHGKIGRFGDKISKGISESSFGKSSFAGWLKNRYNSVKGFVKTKIIDKSRILRAFAFTPSKPELGMVLDQYMGMPGFILMDYPQHGEKFMKPLKHAADLDCYGATKEEIAKYTDLIKQNKITLEEAEFECLKKYSRKNPLSGQALSDALNNFKAMTPEARAEMLRDMKAFEWGAVDFKEFQLVMKEHHKYLPRILEMTHDANPKMMPRIWGSNFSKWQKFRLWLTGREVHSSETYNKLIASLGNYNPAENPELDAMVKKLGIDKKIPKTAFGRWLTKYTNVVLEGATNRVAGGKFIALMQAFYLADVIYKANKQQGGSEKFKSFMERFAEMLGFFVCIPFALKLMHHIGGLQYAGLDKEGVKAYREALKIHNETAMKGGFADKNAWKASRDNLKKMLKADVKNPITKLFKKIGRIVTVGLEQIRPYDNVDIGVMRKNEITGVMEKVYRKGIGQKLRDFWRHPKFGFKQMAGYPMRIILGMAILLPMFNKIMVKGSHLLFGKPKNSLLDEGKEEKIAQQQQQIQQPNFHANQPVQPVQQTTSTTTTTHTGTNLPSDTNLLEKFKNRQSTMTTTTTTQQINKNLQEPLRTYIPSPEGVKITKGEDTTAADAAMRRADSIENEALKMLKMN